MPFDARSMGGLVAADSTLNLYEAYRASESVMWPRILGVLAFDTPYLGVHPGTFANGADQAITYGTQATEIAGAIGSALGIWGAKKAADGKVPPPASSAKESEKAVVASEKAAGKSSWLSYAPVVAGGAVAAAAAGAAIWQHKAISQFASLGWNGVSDHLVFVGELWSSERLRTRLERIVQLDDKGGIRARALCAHRLDPSLLMWWHPRPRLKASGWWPRQLDDLALVQRDLFTLHIMGASQQLRAAERAGDDERYCEVLERLDIELHRWLDAATWRHGSLQTESSSILPVSTSARLLYHPRKVPSVRTFREHRML